MLVSHCSCSLIHSLRFAIKRLDCSIKSEHFSCRCFVATKRILCGCLLNFSFYVCCCCCRWFFFHIFSFFLLILLRLESLSNGLILTQRLLYNQSNQRNHKSEMKSAKLFLFCPDALNLAIRLHLPLTIIPTTPWIINVTRHGASPC